MKPFWEITQEEAEAVPRVDDLVPGEVDYFRGGGFSSDFLTRGGMPVTMAGSTWWTASARCSRLPRVTVDLPGRSTPLDDAPIRRGRRTGSCRLTGTGPSAMCTR